jgi:hypothetical protein
VKPDDPTPKLESLPGVVTATSFLENGAPPRVYLVTTPDVDQDALRDLVVELLADHGYPSLPERIHIGTSHPRIVSGPILTRVSLDALDVSRSQSRVECTVRLRAAERSVSGSASEPDTPSGHARAAARATLAAAEEVDPDFRFGLEGIVRLDLFGDPALALLVDARIGRVQSRLPGTCLLDRSTEEAAALATLQALRSWNP